MNPAALAAALHGRVASPYVDPHSPDRALTLDCYRLASNASDRPVVLVMHGMGRNGDEYRDAWMPAADGHGLLVVAITVPDATSPGARLYNDGHVLADSVRRSRLLVRRDEARPAGSDARRGRRAVSLRSFDVTPSGRKLSDRTFFARVQPLVGRGCARVATACRLRL